MGSPLSSIQALVTEVARRQVVSAGVSVRAVIGRAARTLLFVPCGLLPQQWFTAPIAVYCAHSWGVFSSGILRHRLTRPLRFRALRTVCAERNVSIDVPSYRLRRPSVPAL